MQQKLLVTIQCPFYFSPLLIEIQFYLYQQCIQVKRDIFCHALQMEEPCDQVLCDRYMWRFWCIGWEAIKCCRWTGRYTHSAFSFPLC